ncbi:MAG: hypothetical protein AAGJ95_09485 [Cyanobacteria bacterium J06554_11]
MIKVLLNFLNIDAIVDYLFNRLSANQVVQMVHRRITETDDRVSRVLPYVDAALPMMDIDIPDRLEKAVRLGLEVTGDIAAISTSEKLRQFVEKVNAAFDLSSHLSRVSNPVKLQRLQAELNAVKLSK